MARSGNTYRAARRSAWRKAKLIWRDGCRAESMIGPHGRFYRNSWHASMPQRYGVPLKQRAA